MRNLHPKNEYPRKLPANTSQWQSACVRGVYWKFEPYELRLCRKFNNLIQTSLLSWGRTDRIVRSEVQYAK